jgi:cell division protease FtsH
VKGNDPLHKVTIVPRGRALGLAFTLPEDDRVSITREQLEAGLEGYWEPVYMETP